MDYPCVYPFFIELDLLRIAFQVNFQALTKKLYTPPHLRGGHNTSYILDNAYRRGNLAVFSRVIQYPAKAAPNLVNRMILDRKLSWLNTIANNECTHLYNRYAKFLAQYAMGQITLDELTKAYKPQNTDNFGCQIEEIVINLDRKEEAVKLIRPKRIEVDAKYANMYLCYASKYGYIDLIEYVLKLNPRCLCDNSRAFEAAARHGQFDAYRRLLVNHSFPFDSKEGMRILVEKGPDDLIDYVFSREMCEKQKTKITQLLLPALLKKRLEVLCMILTQPNLCLKYRRWFRLFEFALRDQDIKQVVTASLQISEDELAAFGFFYAATMGSITFIRIASMDPRIPLDHRQIYTRLLKDALWAHSNPQEWSLERYYSEKFCQGKLEPYISKVFVPFAREKKFSLLLDFIKNVPAYARYIE